MASRNAGLYVGTRLDKKKKRMLLKLAVAMGISVAEILCRMVDELLETFSEEQLDEMIKKRMEERDG